ncbi:hypothetical protein BGZ94_010130 [Podila epigama]|nr:hypothetical protein BGZ94_010130 [Podila epigama]
MEDNDHHHHDHDHGHSSTTTPWNTNLSYAIAWSIALGIPIVWMSVRHAVTRVSGAVEWCKTRDHVHTPLASEEPDDDNNEPNNLGNQHHSRRHHTHTASGGLAEQGSTAKGQSTGWTFSRLENWIGNKASATLCISSGAVAHVVAGATLLALILVAILAVVLLRNTDLMINSNRAGYLGLACIPFLFALTGKNSIVSYLTGISHHRINQAHRFVGLCLFVLVSVHMGCMIHTWLPWKDFLAQQLETPKVKYGLATYTVLCIIVLTAAWPVRRWAYEVFVVSHFLFLVFIILVGLHTPYAMRFIVAGVVLYFLNLLTGWCVKTHMAFAQATVFEDRLTRLRMDKSLSHAPGQHVYICVPSMSLIQWHPFTISSTERNILTVHARAVGGFTRSLCLWPDNTPRRVVISGPYGGGVMVGRRQDVHQTVFVAAGSGLAYIVPILADLIQHRQQTNTSNGLVEVVWCVRDPDEVEWFQEELEHILNAAALGFQEGEKDKEDTDLMPSEVPETQIRLRIHYSTLSFEDQESIIVAAPPMTSPAPSRLTMSRQNVNDMGAGNPNIITERITTSNNINTNTNTTAATTTTAAAVTLLDVPFSNDGRVEWVRERLDVGEYVRSKIEDTPEDRTLEIVGCGPPLMLAQLHNAVAAHERLSGCRVHIHTERFYM